LAALQATQQNNNPYQQLHKTRARVRVCIYINKDNKGLGEAEITSDDDDDDDYDDFYFISYVNIKSCFHV
jgi:hypothetical protein